MTYVEEIVQADLARAHRIARQIAPDPIDPQFRIVTPSGDWWIAMTLSEDPEERARQFYDLHDWMLLHQAVGFTMASETRQPVGTLLCIGVGQCHAIIAMHSIEADVFDPKAIEWSAVGPDGWSEIGNALPRGEPQISLERTRDLERVFGSEGTWPAVKIGRDESRARSLN